jgi:NADPH:quinone reductase-like Zn-dependent oxidoreductase
VKAAVYQRYGPPEVVEIKEVAKPAPEKDELLIKVRAATVAAGDWRMRKADPFAARLYNGLFRPKRVNILGFELAGEVEAVGAEVRRFKVGDAVFAFTGFGFGAHAQYRCLRESGPPRRGLVSPKPACMSFDEAAAVPVGGLTAQAFLRRAQVVPGSRVLIYGASGSVGTYAVQLAKHLGAHVTAVCGSGHVEVVRSLGADEIIDYHTEDFSVRGAAFDVVFDAVGNLARTQGRRALVRGGRFLSVKGTAELEGGDLDKLKSLIEAGALVAVTDRRVPLESIVEAHRYVEAGHKTGNVVVSIHHDDAAPALAG